jgi:precorrin-6A/cobalt-precorrin-6A reductase
MTLPVLILGGTSQASALALALQHRADLAPLISLAGRTAQPAASAVPQRIGGFGGPEGLGRWLRDNRIAAVIDATHPFAARISTHAAEAARAENVPLAVYTRPPWRAQAGDRWLAVPDLAAAAAALGERPARVFVTSGRLGLAAFRAAPQHHYLIRCIDAPAPDHLPPDHRLILDRGPFALDDETALLRTAAIEVLVSKNSGGAASAPKLTAARRLGLTVVMVERSAHAGQPAGPAPPVFTELAAVLGWIEAQRSGASATP